MLLKQGNGLLTDLENVPNALPRGNSEFCNRTPSVFVSPWLNSVKPSSDV